MDLDKEESTASMNRKFVVYLLATGVAGAPGPAIVRAQDIPTDAQIQAAFGTVYNHLGLMEYCAAKGFASATDIANTRKMVDAAVAGMDVSAGAHAQEAVGRHGDIVGKQLIGLMRLDASEHPEMVPEGRIMSLADNARAQKTSERTLCRQMAAQAAPLR